MSNTNKSNSGFKKIGQYLDCDPDVIQQTLKKQLAEMNATQAKMLGELLIDARAISPEALNKAVLRQRLDRLRGCEIFSGLNYDELVKVREWVNEVSYESGTEFLVQDTQGDCFYVLIDGQALV